jgi:PAS domain S-box-containing protein
MRAESVGGRIDEVLERVSDAVVSLDQDWRYTYVNKHAAQLFGCRPEDLVGRHIWTVFPEGVGRPFQLAYEKAMAEQVFIRMEDYFEPWDRWFENRIYPSPDGLSIFFHEVTERKLADLTARESADLLRGQNQVLEAIARGEPLRRSLDLLLRVIEAQCPGLLCSIVMLDDDGLHVRHAAAPSLPVAFTASVDGQCIGPSAGSCGTAVFRGEPVIVEDIGSDPLWDGYRDAALAHGLRACWSTPIFDPTPCLARGDGGAPGAKAGEPHRVLGTFALYFRTPGRPDARHWKLIDLATSTAAIAIIRHRETDAITRREVQLAAAQRIAHLGSYEWDVATNAVLRSEELLRIFGTSADEFKPTFEGYLERVHADDRPSTRKTIEEAFRDRVPFEFEERIVRPDGTIRALHSQGKWILDDRQEPVRLVGICHDITERRQAEQRLRRQEEEALAVLEQRVAARTAELHEKNLELEGEIGQRKRVAELLRARNEELKAFAYTVSHDLKAPLRGIAGYAQELHRRHRAGLDERALFCLDQILTATRNLDRLIEDLLHYSRLDAETPTPTDIDLVHMVETILNDRNAVILQHHAEATVSLAAPRVRSWERGLAQTLTNLIDNALKYSRHAKPPRIRISSEQRPDSVQIAVADNGIGFDMKYHDRIFGLFSRLVRQEDFEGTGAGLAIVKKVVEKMGGTVRAESAAGSGSTFFVDLPGARRGSTNDVE